MRQFFSVLAAVAVGLLTLPAVGLGQVESSGRSGPQSQRADRLRSQLFSSDVAVRRTAAFEIAKLRLDDEQTVRSLKKALGDADEIVRYRAVTALGRVGPGSAKTSTSSLDAVLNRDKSLKVVRRAVLAIYLNNRKHALDIFNTWPDRPNPQGRLELIRWDVRSSADMSGFIEARRNALWKVGWIGRHRPESIPKLIVLLREHDRFERRFSAEAMGMIGFKDRSAAAFALVESSNDDADITVREAALEALLLNLDPDVVTRLQEPAPPARPTPEPANPRSHSDSRVNIPELLKLLRAEDELRYTAMTILEERLDSGELCAEVALIAMDSDRELRSRGLSLIWKHAPAADVAGPLAYALQHGLAKVHIVELVNEIDAGDLYSPYLISFILQAEDLAVREAGLDALARVGRRRDWRPLLTASWSHLDEDLRKQVARSLPLLEVKNPVTRAFLAGSLAIGNDEAFAEMVVGLAAAAKGRNERVLRLHRLFRTIKKVESRMTVLRSLGNRELQETDDAVPLLVAILKNEPELSIRDAAVDALRGCETHALSALPTLKSLLQQERVIESRIQIAAAIRAIGVGDVGLQASIKQLESSLRIQHAKNLLEAIIKEQEQLAEATEQHRRAKLIENLKSLRRFSRD